MGSGSTEEWRQLTTAYVPCGVAVNAAGPGPAPRPPVPRIVPGDGSAPHGPPANASPDESRRIRETGVRPPHPKA